MGKNKFTTLSFIATAILWNIHASCTLAQEINPGINSLQESVASSFYNKQVYPTRKLTAVSRSENRGDWWFFKPGDISSESMRSQGCVPTNIPVGSDAPDWRCPRQTIRVEVDGGDSRKERGEVFSEEALQAVSGPDERGRWLFYKPNDISSEEMRSQRCVRINSPGPNWSCPSRMLRWGREDGNPDRYPPEERYGERDWYDEDYPYDPYEDTPDNEIVLQAESGPDARGFWLFYKPKDISSEEMRSQGCVPVSSNRQNWRCPSPTIRLGIEDRYW
ncbi:hypothetical protein F7734_13095 [Scytonema sp. UIC 10036]|uniref:hypothetical protein n=1 Tax=Scytonema sp. UIC 10036 TaxID=2304196 RepID=UPI0012DAC3E8|nr:hypothetical protein [Scytonema sp. UIC 10036]MUG93313.1 hypothetical protein [Scytonema sp. UIC 10036]